MSIWTDLLRYSNPVGLLAGGLGDLAGRGTRAVATNPYTTAQSRANMYAKLPGGSIYNPDRYRSVTPSKGTTVSPTRLTPAPTRKVVPKKPATTTPKPKTPATPTTRKAPTATPSTSVSPFVTPTSQPIGTGKAIPQPAAPTVPKQNLPNYSSIYSGLNGLEREYQNLKYDFTPQKFAYDPWDTEARQAEYDTKARQRTDAETAARMPVWGEQMSAADRNWQAAMEQANLEQERQVRAINANTDQERGRLSNMMANTGMGAGFGAVTNMFGLDTVGRNQAQDVESQYGGLRAGYGAERANAMGAINAEKAGWLGGLPSLQQQYSDAAYDRGYGQYNTDYARNEGTFNQYQGQLADTAMNRLNLSMNSITGRQNLLGERAGLLGDYSSRVNDNSRYVYGANNTRWQDVLNFNEGRSRYGIEATEQRRINDATLAQYASQAAIDSQTNRANMANSAVQLMAMYPGQFPDMASALKYLGG